MIWGNEVGRLSWDDQRNRAVFEYDSKFLRGVLDLAPLSASIHNPRCSMPFYGEANDAVFCGLPAFISDSLPGRWGNTVFAAWAQANNISENRLTAVDKLSFIGRRGMGALEFEPAYEVGGDIPIELDDLYRKAQEILGSRESAVIQGRDLSLDSLYEVGTSAGGQHTKAVIAVNEKTGEIRSGQIMLPSDYTYYLLKFAETDYYPLTRVEMVYYKMACACGITMMPSRLVDIDGEAHFLTERFDRKGGKKVHTQTLAAMIPDAHSYESLMEVCQALQLPYKEREETFKRMVFNVLATNVDAHIRNFSFMLEEGGSWHITPAYDLTFSCYNPGNDFDPCHYLRINGKTMNIRRDDLLSFAERYCIDNGDEVISEVIKAVGEFRSIAADYGVPAYWIDKIEGHFADMSPDMLQSLSGYKPNVFSYIIGDGVIVSDAQWTEMGNGAMRLTANLNGTPFRATFSKNSETTKKVMQEGGIKMPLEKQKEYVEQLFLPRMQGK